MTNVYFNLSQIQSNPDGQPTVNRQSRLMSHQGNLKNLAMIFAVLVMSMANVGTAWGADPDYESYDWSSAEAMATGIAGNTSVAISVVTSGSDGNVSGHYYKALNGAIDGSATGLGTYLSISSASQIDSVEIFFCPNGTSNTNLAWAGWGEDVTPSAEVGSNYGTTGSVKSSKSWDNAVWKKIDLSSKDIYTIYISRQGKKLTNKESTISNFGDNQTVNLLGLRVWLHPSGGGDVECSTPATPDGLTAGSLTATGATFTITDDESPVSYDIYYTTSSTAPTSGTDATATTTSTTKAVTGLTSGTTYYAWVRAVCDGSHKSSWVALTGSTFTTNTAYSVTYNDNGKTSGSVPTDATAYESGASVTVKDNTGSMAKTGYVFAGWNSKDDGTGTDYAPETTFSISANTILYAKWIEGTSATMTWNITTVSDKSESDVDGGTTDIGTTSKTPAENLTTLTDLTGVGVKRTTTGKGGNTGKIETPASYDADKYVSMTFDVASGYEFTPTVVSIKTVAVSTAKDLKLEFIDENGSYSVTKTGLSTSATAATNTLYFTGCTTSFTGTVTVKIYVYGATNAYRLSTPLTITGAVAEAASTKRIYMEAANGWNNDTPYFYAKSWGSADDVVLMTQVSDCETNVFYADIPSGNNNVLFTRQSTNSGIKYKDQDGNYNQSVDINCTSNDKFTFNGDWDKNSTGKSDFNYGTYSAPSYTVTYDDNGSTDGSVPVDSNSPYGCGDDVTVLGNTGSLEKDGYSFNGWNTEDDGTGDPYSENDTYEDIAANVTFYAQWKQEKPTSVAISGGWRYFPGQTVGLKATPTGGTGSFTYQWQKYVTSAWVDLEDGLDETDGGTFSGVTTDSLQISGCTKSNCGDYRCVVSKAGGSTESNGYAVHIYTLEGGYKGDGSSWTAYDLAYTSGTSGSVAVNLNASSSYEFGIKDNYDNSWYRNTNFIISPWTNEGFGKGTGNCRLFTGPEGDYTFTVDIAHVGDGTPYVNVSVDYPDVTHPVEGYVYIPKNWSKCYVHYWYTDGGGDHALTSWGSDVEVTTYVEDLCENDYFYMPAIDAYPKLIIKDAAGDPSNTTGDQTTTGNSGKYIKHNGVSWGWESFATYTITFAANGGSGEMSSINGICPDADQALMANAFTNTGHTFGGWKADVAVTIGGESVSAGTVINDEETLEDIAGNITLTAQWNPITYDITYMDGESEFAGTHEDGYPTTHTYGTETTLKSATKTGYTLEGWYTEAGLENKVTSLGATAFTANITLYAKWTANTYDVAFTLSNAAYSSGTAEGSNVASYGTDYEVVFAASSGYELPSSITVSIGGSTKTAGTEYTWDKSTGELTVGGSYILGNISVSITATAAKYSVTYAANGGSGSAPTDENSYDSGDEVTVLGKNTLSKSGYTFYGWSDGTTTYLEGQKFNIAGNTTLTAVWDGDGETIYYYGQVKIVADTLQKNLNSAAICFFTNTAGVIASSTAISLTSTPGTGSIYYYSNDLSDAGLSTSSRWKSGSEDGRYIRGLKFANGTDYTLKLGTKVATSIKFYGWCGSASKTMTIGDQSYTSNSTKNTFETHEFTKSGGFTGDVTISQDGDFYGILVISVGIASTAKTVTFDKGSGPSTVSNLPSAMKVPSGSKILKPVTDPTATGYTFDGWVTTSGGSTPFDFSGTISENTTIYAKWTAKTTTVTIDANTANHGSTAPSAFTATWGSALPSFTAATGESGYQLRGYYTAATSGTKVIDADGTFSTNDGIWNREDGATLTLYAQYNKTYSVTYKANNSTEEEDVVHGSEVKFADNPSFTAPSMKAFAGWNTEADGTGTHYDVGDEVTEATTVYAEWRYKVVYIASSASESNDVTAALGTKYDVTVRLTTGTAGTEDYSDYALIVLSESLGGSMAGTANHEIKKVIGVDKPILNLKSYFYNDGRWDWGTPNAGKAIKCIYVKNDTYANLTSHPIYTGLTPDGSDSIQILSSLHKDNKPIQPIGSFTSGCEGYAIAVVPNNTGGANGVAIHELTAAQRSTITSETITSKYLMVSLYSGDLSHLSDNGKTLIKNAADYLISGEQWVPQYTVTYVAGANGSGSVDAGTKTHGTDFTLSSSTFTRAGYSQDGWSTTDGGDKAYELGGSYTTDAAITLYPHWTPVTLTFVGKEIKGYTIKDSNWHDPECWSPQCVPTIEHDVVIQYRACLYGPYSVSTSGYGAHDYTTRHGQAKSIVIDKTAWEEGDPEIQLQIWNRSSLIVAEGITVKKAVDAVVQTGLPTTPEDLYIETSVSGNGGLICGSASSTTQAQYDFYTKTYKIGKWYINQYVGIPFTSMDAYLLSGFNIFVYNDVKDKWKTPESSTMEPWTAYNLIRKYSGGTWSTFELTGTLNLPGTTGDGRKKDLECAWRTGGDIPASFDKVDGHQDYMFANSWTAPIDIAAMKDTDFVNMVQTIYIFNAGYVDTLEASQKALGDLAGQWSSFPIASAGELENAIIPATQAFCVTATAENAKLKLDYKKHVYDPAVAADSINIFPTRAPRRAKAGSELSKIRIMIRRDSTLADQLYLFERADFSDEFDNGWDGHKMFGNATAPQLYTKRGNANYAVDAVPDVEGTVVGFRKGSDDTMYKMTFEYNGDKMWYLNDLKTRQSTLISPENMYQFTSYDGDDEIRFIISGSPIAEVPTEIEGVSGQTPEVRKVIIDQKVYIIRNGRMYDPMGKMVK